MLGGSVAELVVVRASSHHYAMKDDSRGAIVQFPEEEYPVKAGHPSFLSQDCVREAKLALPFLEPSLLQKYHELQRRLGYPIGSA